MNDKWKRLPSAIVISRCFSIWRNSSRISIGILEKQMNSDKSFEHLGETSWVKWDHRVYLCTDTIFFNSRRSCSMVQRGVSSTSIFNAFPMRFIENRPAATGYRVRRCLPATRLEWHQIWSFRWLITHGNGKVWILWEGHKMWKKSSSYFWQERRVLCVYLLVKKSTKIFQNKCAQVVLYKL